jgi:hypothetical protein
MISSMSSIVPFINAKGPSTGRGVDEVFFDRYNLDAHSPHTPHSHHTHIHVCVFVYIQRIDWEAL